MNHALTLALATSLTLGAAPVSVEAVEPEAALCQLNLYGTVGKNPHPWVSISVSHQVEGEVVETSLIGQVKAGTSSGSLAPPLHVAHSGHGSHPALAATAPLKPFVVVTHPTCRCCDAL